MKPKCALLDFLIKFLAFVIKTYQSTNQDFKNLFIQNLFKNLTENTLQ